MNILSQFDYINDISSNIIYCSLDTKEGADCFGHWIYECAVFIPSICKLKELYPTLKILLYCPRKFKINTLKDFGLLESDIEYSTNMSDRSLCRCNEWYKEELCNHDHTNHGWVLPATKDRLYIPHFFYSNRNSVNNINFFKCVKEFQEHYNIYNYNVQKSIPFLYLIRSRKENYSLSTRIFENLDDMLSLSKKHDIKIIDIDTLSSIREQVNIVLQANVIIHEDGSSLVNSTFFSKNSHAVILGRIGQGANMLEIYDKLLNISNTTICYFENLNTYRSIRIDMEKLEEHIIYLKDLISKGII